MKAGERPSSRTTAAAATGSSKTTSSSKPAAATSSSGGSSGSIPQHRRRTSHAEDKQQGCEEAQAKDVEAKQVVVQRGEEAWREEIVVGSGWCRCC